MVRDLSNKVNILGVGVDELNLNEDPEKID